MSKFSPSEAALEGFRLTREQPGSILVWSLFFFAGIMLTFAVMVLGLGPDFVKFAKQGGMLSGDIGAYTAILGRSWPSFVLVLMIVITVWSVLIAAIYRAVLRPHESRFAYLRFGGDEVRLTLTNLVLVPIGVLSAIFVRGFDAAIGGLLGAVSSFAIAIFMIWIGVRLMLATPMTFAERRIAITASWKLTHNHFWSLFGMTGLAIIFYLIVWLVCTIVSAIFVATAGGQEMMRDPTTASPLALFAIAVTALIQLLLPALQIVLIFSPLAIAYRELHDEEAGPAITPPPPKPVVA